MTSRVSQASVLLLMVLVMLFVVTDYIVMPVYTRQGSERPVPDLLGMTVEKADTVARSYDFEVVIQPAIFGGTSEEGVVLEQHPLPKSLSKPGRKIHLVPSRGIGFNVVPCVIGLEARDARVRARNVGLVCGATEVTYQFSKMMSQGRVLEQIPVEGSEVEPGATMRLVVSLGSEPESIRMPSLIETSLHDARQAIIEAGLTLGRISRKETNVYIAGTVIAQSLRTGTVVKPATRVDLVVAVPVPSSKHPDDDL